MAVPTERCEIDRMSEHTVYQPTFRADHQDGRLVGIRKLALASTAHGGLPRKMRRNPIPRIAVRIRADQDWMPS
jgi:hypothetical protein